ncbi:MAG TPA: hypothetical protein VKF40_14535 [Burkholderiales bacterium]|nr:hypothetical protein [Burkholderiales bacterium]
MRDLFSVDVMMYLAAVLLALGMLMAVTTAPASLLPGAGAHEVVQAAEWVWDAVGRLAPSCG